MVSVLSRRRPHPCPQPARRGALGCGLLFALVPFAGAAAEDAAPISAADREFFENRIRPLLVENCYSCHSSAAKKLRGGLRLDSRAGWRKGGDTGPAIVPGKLAESLLWRAVSYEDPDLQMPPKRKLAPREIAALREWITRGAPDPRADAPAAPAAAAPEVFDLAQRRAAHWAWQPLEVVPPPAARDHDWARDGLDGYILARLEAAGLAPAPPAEKVTWLRRVTFDLTGLPPTRAEIEAFLREDSAAAYEEVVERLLDSPRYGEHWAQRWLDLVRYAETKGHEADYSIPAAYRYRDYVIRAFNADVPYDQLVTEHIAGDLVDPPRLDPVTRTNQSIQATGFWHLGEATHSPVDIRGEEADRVANQIDVFSKTFLGLSVGCARCHEHKFDAIDITDYYALAGYLQSSSYHLMDVADPEAQKSAYRDLTSLREAFLPRIIDAYAAVLAAQVSRVDEYLLAAAAFSRGGARAASAAESDAVRWLATDRGLAPEVLERWVDALSSAAADARDPLYAFAALAALPMDSPPSAFARRKRELLAEWGALAAKSEREFRSQKVVTTVEEGERNYVKSERAVAAEDVVVDYAQAGPGDWIAVGYRFAAAPAAAGEFILGTSPERPLERVLERGEACTDLHSQRFSGMLRTRTFEVTSDTLWYRFRGQAEVFLAVDSHRTVAGPLHGVVKQKLEGGDRFEWKAHNVRDYIGHRVHVEFTPEAGFSLSGVRFSASEPIEVFRVNLWLARLLESPAASIATVARLYRDLFVGRVAALGEERAQSDTAEIANYLLARGELLDPPGAAEMAALAEVFGDYLSRKEAIERRIPASISALALVDGSGEDEYVHIRGNHRTLAREPTRRRFLAALAGYEQAAPERGSGRLELARRMTGPGNPLLSRVLVNRLWHHLFGRGIVATVDDFGVMGKRPSHPRLLDYLAAELVREGWSIKKLLRRIVLSSTYRMSSRPDDEAARADPTNELLHRMRIRRLEGEAIRDSILGISGRLDPTMYGPGVMVHITPFMRGNRSPPGSGPIDGAGRRSIYIEVRRNHLSHFLAAFDKPPPFTTIGRRSVSNSPAQPLILLNDPFVHQQAALWAERLLAAEGREPEELVTDAYLAAFARPPADWEVAEALSFLRAAGGGAGSKEAWTEYCHALMNVKEFIYLN